MWVVQFQARCEHIRPNYSALNAADAARRIEAALSVALLELCGYVEVGAVSVAIEADTPTDTPTTTAVNAAVNTAVGEKRPPALSIIRAAAMANGREVH